MTLNWPAGPRPAAQRLAALLVTHPQVDGACATCAFMRQLVVPTWERATDGNPALRALVTGVNGAQRQAHAVAVQDVMDRVIDRYPDSGKVPPLDSLVVSGGMLAFALLEDDRDHLPLALEQCIHDAYNAGLGDPFTAWITALNQHLKGARS